MNKKVKEKLTYLSKETQNSRREPKIEFDESHVLCKVQVQSLLSICTFFVLTTTIPIIVLYFEFSWFLVFLLLIIVTLFLKTFFDILLSERELYIDFTLKKINVKNSSNIKSMLIPLMKLFRAKGEYSIRFNDIESIFIKKTSRYKYSSEESQIYVRLNNSKKILLTEFCDSFFADSFLFSLRNIFGLKN